MEAFEIVGKVDETGKLIISESLPIRNKKVRIVLMVDDEEKERMDWLKSSIATLNKAYDEDEAEYPLSGVKEPNPKYKGHD